MTKPLRFPLIAATLATSALLAACGGGDDDPAVVGDSSGDVVAKYIGTWESDCYADSGASAKIRADFIQGMGKVEGRFVIILNVDRVLSPPDLTMLASLSSFGSEEG